MNFKGDFIKIGSIDTTALRAVVANITDEEWTASGWRQNKFEAHTDTHTIPIVFDTDFRHSDPTYLPKYYEYKNMLVPLTTLISGHFNKLLSTKRLQKKNGRGYLIRMILVRLKPEGVIPPHGDQGYSLLHAHRIHLPVISQGNTKFTVGDTTMSLREGDVWEINNKRTHSVINHSDTPRIHIISDWVIPGERCCCGKNLRPKGICSPQECRTTDNAIEECGCYPH